MQLQQCPSCSRKFNPKSYAKHIKHCAKVFKTKRKAFSMTDKRIAEAAAAQGGGSNTRASSYGRRNKRQPRGARKGRAEERSLGGAAAKAKKSSWKNQSSALRQAMKQSRMVEKYKKEGRLSELPPMESSGPDPSLIPCPNCGRSFNEKAAARHIPKCKNIKAKPKRLMRGTGHGQGAGRRKPSSSSRGQW